MAQQVSTGQQFSYPSIKQAKQFSSNIHHLATFEEHPTRFQELALCLDHPQQYQLQLSQFLHLYSIQQVQFA